MAIETSRKVLGTSEQGEVVLITKQNNKIRKDGTVGHVNSYVVRQGSHTVLETDDRKQAQTVAAAL